MGTQNRRLNEIGDLDSLEKLRNKIQFEIDSEIDIETRRRFGQFSTPFPLAQEMMDFGLSLLKNKEIYFLEPAIGTGSFFSALLSESSGKEFSLERATGIEIDKNYLQAAQQLWKENNITLYNQDFSSMNPEGSYNYLVTNPPYVRHHYIDQPQKKRLAQQVKEETGINISGLAGFYCYMMLLAHKWLAPGAVCGWLIPSEFMDVNYGSALKEYLLNSVHLLKIHRYDPDCSQFEDALVSSCAVWFINEKVTADYEIEFTLGGSHQSPKLQKKIKKSDLLGERKWTRFPEQNVRKKHDDVPKLGDFFTIKRGLATGDNSFFILPKEQITELGLDMKFFTPVLPSPRNLKTDYIEPDKHGNPFLNPQYFLLNCKLSEDEIKSAYPQLWTYLLSGKEKTGSKYLCRNRKTWYFQEQRDPTYFLCSYMGRGKSERSPIRFIMNKSKAVATNSYLMLYPKDSLKHIIENDDKIVERIWKELQTITSRDIEDEGRIYGGGLKKIEPKELSNVRCKGLQFLFEL